ILASILVMPERRTLRTPWPWLAGGLAFAVGSPSIIGQIVLGWPFLQQFQDLADVQLVHVSPITFVSDQLLMVGPVLLPALAAALMSLRTGGGGGRSRAERAEDAGTRLVIAAAVIAFVLMLLARGKPYYIA